MFHQYRFVAKILLLLDIITPPHYNLLNKDGEAVMKLNEIHVRDPFVLKEGGKYYLYGTEGKNAWGGKAIGFYVYVSDDMVEFERKCVFLPNERFWADENYWAPEVHKINGRFYMFASFFKEGQLRRSQILSCDTPDGLFEPLPEPLTPADMQCLDATYFNHKGKHYTVFCHEWLQCKDGEMCLAELDGNLKICSPITVLFRASEAPWTLGFDGGNFVTDGPFIYPLKSGKLLMLWSSNSPTGYAMGMAVADDIEGPWTHIEKPLISNNGGHGMIFKDGEKLFITFHLPNDTPLERPHFLEICEEENELRLV